VIANSSRSTISPVSGQVNRNSATVSQRTTPSSRFSTTRPMKCPGASSPPTPATSPLTTPSGSVPSMSTCSVTAGSFGARPTATGAMNTGDGSACIGSSSSAGVSGRWWASMRPPRPIPTPPL
jgi:hypothetical protein